VTNQALTDGIREITLAVRGLDGIPRIRPGAHVTLQLPQAGGRSTARIYSVWRQSPGGAQLAIRVLLHPRGGPGTVWARSAEVGEEITIGAPHSKITLDQRAKYHVFLGDENGAVPLLAMRGGLAPEVAVYGAFQAFDQSFRVPAPAGVAALPWVEQPHPSGRTSFPVLDAARALELPAGIGCAYVAGEANLCKAVFRHFVEERRWPRSAVKTQPQWATGRTGFGVGHSDW
jgi:NADPH-dependent ferric siderophore reductase